MFLVVFRLDDYFGFDDPFVACPIGRESKIARPKKVGGFERNLSIPLKAFFPEIYSEPSNI